MTNMEVIFAERERQIKVEGWTAEHDDQHYCGEMLYAARIYYQNAKTDFISLRPNGAPVGWPWDAVWWKPKDKRRDLIRAGALCVAERERLIRADKSDIAHSANHLLTLIIESLNKLEQADDG